MTLYAAYVPLLNFLARLFGAIAFLVGAFSMVGAYAFKADRWTRVVAGVFLISVGVAMFMGKTCGRR